MSSWKCKLKIAVSILIYSGKHTHFMWIEIVLSSQKSNTVVDKNGATYVYICERIYLHRTKYQTDNYN